MRWVRRAKSLKPVAAVGVGEVARRLAARILAVGVEGLRGVATDEVLVVIGRTEVLPWVDGVVYLGSDPIAPALWTPTLLRPDRHPALVLRSIGGTLKLEGPIAALPDALLAIPLARARALDPSALRAWMDL